MWFLWIAIILLSGSLEAKERQRTKFKSREQRSRLRERRPLKQRNAECVVADQQIHIDGVDFAFNPAMIWHKDRFLVVYRYFKDHWPTKLGFIYLNKDLHPITSHQKLIYSYDPSHYPSLEDPRLIELNGEIYMVCCHLKDLLCDENRVINSWANDMYLAKLAFSNNDCWIDKIILLKHKKFFGCKPVEKNWAPFVYEGSLYLSYTMNPHEVLKVDLESGWCTSVAKTSFKYPYKWGPMRGGTNTYELDDCYLSFYHSWKMIRSGSSNLAMGRHYFMGAALIEKKPPFKIFAITEPIVNKNVYKPSDHQLHLVCVFPAGLCVVEDKVYLSYGKDDLECRIMTLDFESIKDHLIHF